MLKIRSTWPDGRVKEATTDASISKLSTAQALFARHSITVEILDYKPEAVICKSSL